MDFKILKQIDQLQPYVSQVADAADRNRDSFGFLPQPVYQQNALQGRLWVCVSDEDEYIGHLIFGGKYPSLRIIQIYVEKNFRGYGIAACLLSELEKYGEELHYMSISAKVAADLKANQFYEQLGYKVARQVAGGKTKDRRINIRAKDLKGPSLFESIELPTEKHHMDLKVKPKTILTNTTYAIDVNVLLDLIRSRKYYDIVQKLLGFSMYGNGQICITSEFTAELEKSTNEFGQDPLLALSKSLPTLPKVSEQTLEPIISQLKSVIFPDRYKQDCINNNDESDLKHVAQCIHHDINGFITSDNAILKAAAELYDFYKIEIISPSSFIDLTDMSELINKEELSLQHDGSVLTISFISESERQSVERFLLYQGVTVEECQSMLDPGVLDQPRNRWIAKSDESIVGFASWGGDELKSHRMFYLVIEEQRAVAQKLIDHFIEKITSSTPKNKLILIALYTTIGSDLTRQTAIDRGFRKNSGIDPYLGQCDLIKISYNGYISNSSWIDFRTSISESVDISLPDRMPTYDEFIYTGAVIKSKSDNEITKISLFEMETLFSPAVFLCDRREAVIVPIKKQYVDRLLSEPKRQLSLLQSNEALLYAEKAYFRSARNLSLFREGDLLLFYVSGKDGGQKIIGHGRMTSSGIIDVPSALLKLKRQGALDEYGLRQIADNDGKLHAITFDNFAFFRNPIPYEYLKKNQLISKANLITAERINHDTLINLIHKGDSRE